MFFWVVLFVSFLPSSCLKMTISLFSWAGLRHVQSSSFPADIWDTEIQTTHVLDTNPVNPLFKDTPMCPGPNVRGEHQNISAYGPYNSGNFGGGHRDESDDLSLGPFMRAEHCSSWRTEFVSRV